MPHHQMPLMPLFNTLSVNSFLKQKKGHLIASHKAEALCCRDRSAGQDFKAPRAGNFLQGIFQPPVAQN